MNEIIEKYGIRLIRLKQEHLEMVRVWRNSDYVRKKMVFQDIISPEMQEKWFHKINNNENYYYIAEYGGEYVGLSNIKDIANGEAEPGVFLSDEKYEDTDIAARISLATGYVAFELLNLDKLIIHVLKSNTKALKYNLFMGYKTIEEKSTSEIAYMEIYKNQASKKLNIIKQFLTSKTI